MVLIYFIPNDTKEAMSLVLDELNLHILEDKALKSKIRSSMNNIRKLSKIFYRIFCTTIKPVEPGNH